MDFSTFDDDHVANVVQLGFATVRCGKRVFHDEKLLGHMDLAA
jgi:hypothetical protein